MDNLRERGIRHNFLFPKFYQTYNPFVSLLGVLFVVLVIKMIGKADLLKRVVTLMIVEILALACTFLLLVFVNFAFHQTISISIGIPYTKYNLLCNLLTILIMILIGVMCRKV